MIRTLLARALWLVGLLVLTSRAHAQIPMVTIAGPVTFARTTGAPTAQNFTFDAPSAGDGVLKLVNGNAAGNNRVSSCVIRLNGVTVVPPNALNQNVTTFSVSVNLLASQNTLTVELRGAPQSTLTLSVLAPRDLNPLDVILSDDSVKLVGLAPNAFNPQSAPLLFSVSNTLLLPSLNEVVLTVNKNRVPNDLLTIGPNSIRASSVLVDGRNDIFLSTVDVIGRPLYFHTTIWAGSYTLRVDLLNKNGTPFTDAASMSATLSDNSSVSQQVSTATGVAIFQNVPFRTILLQAIASSNRYGQIGVVGTQGYAQIRMLGFDPPSSVKNNDFSQGTVGWNIGGAPVQIIPHVEGGPFSSRLMAKGAASLSSRGEPPLEVAPPQIFNVNSAGLAASSIVDQDLALNTSGEGQQSISRTFNTEPGTSAVIVRYRFITSEVPGGWFGSRYNDYFQVSLRSQLGGGAAGEANSMNGLGLAAFDYASGATEWRDVTLQVNPEGDTIQVDAGVANVGDGAFDSQVVIDFVREVRDQVHPTLAWNSTQGGLNLSYRVEGGNLAQNTTINVYWANGTSYNSKIGAPIFSYVVPAGTQEGEHGPIRITGNLLSEDPVGVTHLIAASSETNVGNLADVHVGYGAQANPAHVDTSMIDIIKDGLRAAGQSAATIMSTARTTEDQARAMWQNLVRDINRDGQLTLQEIAHNVNEQHNGDGVNWTGYGSAGDAVINVFEQQIASLSPPQILANEAAIRNAMQHEVENQVALGHMGNGHLADPAVRCVVDVGRALFNDSNRPLFVNAVQSRVSYFLNEPANNCFHLELQL